MDKIIEDMYQQYLKKVKLEESKMPEVQKKETRRAFFGGASSTLAAVTDDEMDDVERGIDIIGSMFDECAEFWREQTKED